MINNIKQSSLFKLFTYVKKYFVPYTIGLVAMSSTNFIFSIISAVAVRGLSDASISKNLNQLIRSLIFTAAGLGMVVVVIPFMGYMFNSSVKRITADIRISTFSYIQQFQLSYIEEQHSGDILSRITNDIGVAENVYGSQIMMLIMAVISAVGSVITMISYSWKIGLVAIGLGLINTFINTLFVKPLKNSSVKIQKGFSSLNQTLSDVFAGNTTIKTFNLYSIIENKYNDENKYVRDWSMKRVVLNSLLNSLNSLLGLMTFILLIIIGGIMVMQGQLEFGVLMAEILMLNSLLWAFNSFGSFINEIQTSLAGADRLFEIFDVNIENYSCNQPTNVNIYSENAIEFNDVVFAYNNEKNIINNVTFKIENRSTVAIVGPSGSGKSTLFKLVLGFYNLSLGSIKIFNKDIKEYGLNELRKLIAYVPQNTFLFNGTIAENVRSGKEEASFEEIVDACKQANIHDFIISLPNGYDSQVGEGGKNLSGGQRQRIAIARAILKDAPILLLDEATSALDSESEQQIQQALDVIMRGRTVLVIAHRLSTIKSADKIYVFDKGHIVEQGTNEQLLLNNKLYKDLYNKSMAN